MTPLEAEAVDLWEKERYGRGLSAPAKSPLDVWLDEWEKERYGEEKPEHLAASVAKWPYRVAATGLSELFKGGTTVETGKHYLRGIEAGATRKAEFPIPKGLVDPLYPVALARWAGEKIGTRKLVRKGAKSSADYLQGVIDRHPEWQKGLIQENVKRSWKDYFDPDFVGRTIAEQAPIMGSIVAAGAIGGPAGLTAAAGTLEAGAWYDEAIQRGVDPEKAADTAVIVGVINAGLEAAPLGLLTKKAKSTAGKLLRRKIVEKTIDELAKQSKTTLRNIARDIGTQTAAEAFTEALQEITSNAAKKTYDENQPLLDRAVLDAAVAGAWMGGMTMGGRGAAELGAQQVQDKRVRQIKEATGKALTRPISRLAEQRAAEEVEQRPPETPEPAPERPGAPIAEEVGVER